MKLIERTSPAGLDHALVCNGYITWKRPPAITPEWEDEIRLFSDNLVQTSQDKLVELLDRIDELEGLFAKNVVIINKELKGDKRSRFFWIALQGFYLEETMLIKRWLRYWQRVYEISSDLPIFRFSKPKMGVDPQSVEQARLVPLESLYDGHLSKSYGRFCGLCPFHEERTPSFTIYPDNHYFCFGCKASGDSISYYMKKMNKNFKEAVYELGQRG